MQCWKVEINGFVEFVSSSFPYSGFGHANTNGCPNLTNPSWPQSLTHSLIHLHIQAESLPEHCAVDAFNLNYKEPHCPVMELRGKRNTKINTICEETMNFTLRAERKL